MSVFYPSHERKSLQILNIVGFGYIHVIKATALCRNLFLYHAVVSSIGLIEYNENNCVVAFGSCYCTYTPDQGRGVMEVRNAYRFKVRAG